MHTKANWLCRWRATHAHKQQAGTHCSSCICSSGNMLLDSLYLKIATACHLLLSQDLLPIAVRDTEREVPAQKKQPVELMQCAEVRLFLFTHTCATSTV